MHRESGFKQGYHQRQDGTWAKNAATSPLVKAVERQEAMRAAFEAWARPRLFDMRPLLGNPDAHQYRSLECECAWQAWQAATEARQP